MQKLRKKWADNPFITFFFSYVIFLLIILSVGVFSLNLSSSAIEERVSEAHYAFLLQEKTVVDSRITEVVSAASKFLYNAKLSALHSSGGCETPDSLVLMRELQSDIRGMLYTNPIILRADLYFPNGDFVLGNISSYRLPALENWSESNYHMPLDELRELAFDSFTGGMFIPVFNPVTNRADILYIRTLDILPSKNRQAVILVTISGNELTRGLLEYEKAMQSPIYILMNGSSALDSNLHETQINTSFAGLQGSERIYSHTDDGKKYYIIHIYSKILDAEYVNIVPASVFLSRVNQMRRILLLILVGFLVIGIGLAIYFSRKNATPIKTMEKVLAKTVGEKNGSGYAFIERAIAGLIDEYSSLEKELEAQKRRLRESFLERLVKNRIPPGSAAEGMAYYNVVLGGEFFSCVLYHITDKGRHFSGGDQNESVKLLYYALQNAVEEMVIMKNDCFLCQIEDILCCVISGSGEESEFVGNIIRTAEDAICYFSEKLDVKIIAVASSCYGQAESIPAAYTECADRMEALRQGSAISQVYAGDARENTVCEISEPETAGTTHERIIIYLQKHFTDPMLSVAGVAEHFELNRTYLSGMFKEKTSTGLLEYISKLRLEESKRLMHTCGDMGLSEIAEKCGYYDSHSMNVAFKKFEGVPPSVYRKSL